MNNVYSELGHPCKRLHKHGKVMGAKLTVMFRVCKTFAQFQNQKLKEKGCFWYQFTVLVVRSKCCLQWDSTDCLWSYLLKEKYDLKAVIIELTKELRCQESLM